MAQGKGDDLVEVILVLLSGGQNACLDAPAKQLLCGLVCQKRISDSVHFVALEPAHEAFKNIVQRAELCVEHGTIVGKNQILDGVLESRQPSLYTPLGTCGHCL